MWEYTAGIDSSTLCDPKQETGTSEKYAAMLRLQTSCSNVVLMLFYIFPQAEMRAAVFLAMEEQDKLEVRLCSLGVPQRDVLLRLIFFICSLEKSACHQRELEKVSQH